VLLCVVVVVVVVLLLLLCCCYYCCCGCVLLLRHDFVKFACCVIANIHSSLSVFVIGIHCFCVSESIAFCSFLVQEL